MKMGVKKASCDAQFGGGNQRGFGTLMFKPGCYLPVLTNSPKIKYEVADSPITKRGSFYIKS